MKIAINQCYGGFSLSPKAIRRIAELQGRDAYFFSNSFSQEGDKYKSIPFEEAQKDSLFITAFDIPNPNEVFKDDGKAWNTRTDEEKEASNKLYSDHVLDSRYDEDKRNDPLLIQVIEELGSEADGKCAELGIVEIPDGVEWELAEYDGIEWIAEKHRTWR